MRDQSISSRIAIGLAAGLGLFALTPLLEASEDTQTPTQLTQTLRESQSLKRNSAQQEIAKSEAHIAAIRTFRAGSTLPKDAQADQKAQQMLDKAYEAPRKAVELKESDFFYALQTHTLTPMSDGGHPIDAPGAPLHGMHGLVGGTTWTLGFQRPRGECDPKCKEGVDRQLAKQLELHCSSQSDPTKCLHGGLPFRKENYDFVVSMGSSHSAIEDLATRVTWDGAKFGEFSRKNKEIFASLKGRQFDTLDCHSNGAMLCLAALRSGETTAKEVRLFGPQINPGAAALWRDYAASTGAKIKIYINNGDPVPAASWKQPTPQTLAGKAATAVWLTNPITGPATFSNALFHTWLDSKKAVMDEPLKGYGFEVKRFFPCGDSPDIVCHSMRLYEEELKKFEPPPAINAVGKQHPPSSSATTFWDDELEAGNTGYNQLVDTMAPCGGLPSFEYDTSNKVSGVASLKLNYPRTEFTLSPNVVCGGFANRDFTQTDNLWGRFYIRLSPGFILDPIHTKVMRNDETDSALSFLWGFLLTNDNLMVQAQNYPTQGNTTNLYPNVGNGKVPNNGQFVCIETHIRNNTVGAANGAVEAWKDGVQFMNYTSLEFRHAGQFSENLHFNSNRMYRQGGSGSINYDRLAFGNTRIGCLGSVPTNDSTPPAPPVGLFIR